MGASNSSNTTLLIAIGATSLSVAAGLIALQSDYVSRRILSHEKLQAKRQAEYSYRWHQCLERIKLKYYYRAESSAIGLGKITVLSEEKKLEELIHGWIKENKKTKGTADEGVDNDPSSSRVWRMLCVASGGEEQGEKDKEIYLEFEYRMKVPLLLFGEMLAKAFEDKITTTALCFVADASSGLGSKFLAGLLDASKAGVAIIREPSWMVSFAALVEQRIIRREKLEQILFGLCRLEAWRVRDQVGDARTVMFTLPGQAVSAVLLPLLQSAFPEDRHVFVYDNCNMSVRRGMHLKSNFKRGKLPETIDESFTISDDPTKATTPLLLKPTTALSTSLYGLSSALAKLPIAQADTVETWMGSVDSFFKLKENETKNGYLPYVLRLDYLLSNKDDISSGTDRYWSISSLLQFIVGCRSTSLSEGVLDASIEYLRDYTTQNIQEERTFSELTAKQKADIEDSVFQHKLILIQDKTLKDTVLPKQHWTLKQAVKNGCACCAPEEDLFDEDVKEEQQNKSGQTSFLPGQGDPENDDDEKKTYNNGGKYVDGKTTFAFDPTAFSSAKTTKKQEPPKYVDGKTTFAFDPTKFN